MVSSEAYAEAGEVEGVPTVGLPERLEHLACRRYCCEVTAEAQASAIIRRKRSLRRNKPL